MNITNLFLNDKQNIFILISIWIGLMFIINPIGNFPLNDSWSYAKPVQSLLNGEGIKFTGWMSMTLFSQVLWGALWCKIFGFSFSVLRFSTLFLGGVGVVYSYKLIREFVTDKSIVFLLTLLILFNPIYFNLSYTFMTEIPYYTTSILAIFYYLKFLDNEKNKLLILATIFVIVSILIRQLSLVIPLALMLIGGFKFYKEKRFKPGYYIPFLICIIIYFAYQKIAMTMFNASGRYDERNQIFIDSIISNPISWIVSVFNRNVIGMQYVTLFISPFIFSFFVKSKKVIGLISLLIGTAFFWYLKSKDYIFPIIDNIIYNYGLGPATLYDYWFRDIQSEHQIGLDIWYVISFITSVLFIFTLILIIKNSQKLKDKITYQNVFVLLSLLGYLALTGSIPTYDRYYLLPIPLVIVLIFNFFDVKIYKSIITVLIIPFVWFSIAGTHDYLAWNKARWNCVNYLMEKEKVKPNKIDGGFEFNGWYNYNDDDYNAGLKNMWAHDIDYIIAFNKLKGTSIVKEFTYSNWLHCNNLTIKVLKKNQNFEEMKDLFYTDYKNFKD